MSTAGRPDQGQRIMAKVETKVEHTPMPWTSKVYDTQVILYGPKKIQVLATSWHGSIRKSYPLKAESLANAEYALMAINSHADLVRALEEIRDGLADTKITPGLRMTILTKFDAYNIACEALAPLIARKAV